MNGQTRPERTAWRDTNLSLRHAEYNDWDAKFSARHRIYGYNCPLSNLDSVVSNSGIATSDTAYCESDAYMPRAFCEYKNEHWNMPTDIKGEAWAKLLVNIAAPHKVPAYLAVYSTKDWWYRCWPLNQWADAIFKPGQYLSEREYVSELYSLRSRTPPVEVLELLNNLKPLKKHIPIPPPRRSTVLPVLADSQGVQKLDQSTRKSLFPPIPRRTVSSTT